MSYSVRVTAGAERELREILRWLNERSRLGAAAWSRRWSRVLDELTASAASFPTAPEDEDHEETIRQVVFKTRRGLPYRAIFIIRDDAVFILHIRGPGQDVLNSDEFEFPG